MALTLFTVFPELPLELRREIWRRALPERVPTLYPYWNSSWDVRYLKESDAGYQPDVVGQDLIMEFNIRDLRAAHVKLPSVYVNREAREVALAWARQHGIRIQSYGYTGLPFFRQPFQASYDTLYVPADQWHEFKDGPRELLSYPDIGDRETQVTNASVRHIAVPESLLHAADVTGLLEDLEFYPNFSTLFVILNSEPDFEPTDGNLRMQPQWKLEQTRGGFTWDQSLCAFTQEHVKCMDHPLEVSLEGIRLACRALAMALIKCPRSFKIKPAFAVKHL
ncbi:hypothetical protein JX265_003391 [Neoarthrinium moseri]|uniref:2EXR domain-containing protein n=1 Tax=Neoarthrinium moseri TaxID=1658444 RepID=A0A9P9WS69_9PEZI|nr:hypothetical protein JX265_003391 [Neoarthrinium moseri]